MRSWRRAAMITHCPVVWSNRNCDCPGSHGGNGRRSATGAGGWPGNEKNNSPRPSASVVRVGAVTLIGSHRGRCARVKLRQTGIPQKRGWSRVFGDATALSERARNWAVGSDPGLLRLRMATRTTGALATALLVLFLLTKAPGQPLTVALLGALVTMVSARSVNEPDPRRQRITRALLPLPTALALTAAALVAPHPVIGDVLFVLVVFLAAYARRFGPRGTTLGMVTFMSYFFSLYLRAQFSELPWLIGATVIGTLCSFIWSAFIMPD